MNIEQYTIAMLARAMWRAGFLYGGDFDATFAELSGHVIRNRVIAACGQVSWLEALNAMDLGPGRHEVDRPEDPRFLKILWEAERLYLNQSPDRIAGALDYSAVAVAGHAILCTAPVGEGRTIYFYRGPLEQAHGANSPGGASLQEDQTDTGD